MGVRLRREPHYRTGGGGKLVVAAKVPAKHFWGPIFFWPHQKCFIDKIKMR